MVVDKVIHFIRGVSSFVWFFFTCMHPCTHMSTLCIPMDSSPSRLLCLWDFLGKNSGVACHFLLQIFHISCIGRWILYHWVTWEAWYFFVGTKMCPLYSDSNSNIMTQNSTLFLILFLPLFHSVAQISYSYFTYLFCYFCFQSLFPTFYLMLSFLVALTNMNHNTIDKTSKTEKCYSKSDKSQIIVFVY